MHCKCAVRGDTVFARAAGVIEEPWTKVAVTRGAGLGGEFKFGVDLYMLSVRCMLTSNSTSVLMNLGFLICEMGKYLIFSEFWRLNEGRKGCDRLWDVWNYLVHELACSGAGL